MKNTGTPMIHRITLKDRSGRVIGEKEVASYALLLDAAHREGLDSIETSILQFPIESNGFVCITRAVVHTRRGTFTGIGDASAQNVAPQVAAHFVRMSETRAVARALRSAVNVGAVSLEELGADLDFHASAEPQNDNATTPSAASTAGSRARESSRASDSQRRLIHRLLLARGIEGEHAREYVQRALGVSSLREADKRDVSRLIDQLKADESNASGTGTGG